MAVEDILSKYDAKTAALALELRKFVLRHLKNVTEIPDGSTPLIGYGYGTDYKDMICTIHLSKKGVKLGFYKGSELPDPSRLLTGTGKVHKYVEIKDPSTIAFKALDQLMKQARSAYEKRSKSKT